MKKVKSLRMKNELFYSLKKFKGILNYIIIITGDTVKCGVNIVIYATHTLMVGAPRTSLPNTFCTPLLLVRTLLTELQ